MTMPGSRRRVQNNGSLELEASRLRRLWHHSLPDDPFERLELDCVPETLHEGILGALRRRDARALVEAAGRYALRVVAANARILIAFGMLEEAQIVAGLIEPIAWQLRTRRKA